MAVGEWIVAIFYFIDHHVHDLNQEGQQRLFFIFPSDIGKAYVLDIIELCQKAKDTGNLKAWAAAQANLIKALGEAPENNIDPRLLEKHQIVIPIQVNNNTYNLDLNKFLNIPIDQRTRIADALINPATDDDITEIMNS